MDLPRSASVTCLAVLAAVTVVLRAAPAARAADTIETWDVGAADVEFYLSADDLGGKPPERAALGELVLGIGIAPRLSAYFAADAHADPALGDASVGLAAGVFGTAVDTAHVDVDVLLELSAAGDGYRDLELAPGLELNLDAAPDRVEWGVYVRVSAPIQAQPLRDGPFGLGAIALVGGAYAMVAEGHQLLLEVAVDVPAFSSSGTRDAVLGGLGVGYNVVLSDTLELVSELTVTPPFERSELTVGASIGFIVTLPGGPPLTGY